MLTDDPACRPSSDAPTLFGIAGSLKGAENAKAGTGGIDSRRLHW
jgi:hypothetical protein